MGGRSFGHQNEGLEPLWGLVQMRILEIYFGVIQWVSRCSLFFGESNLGMNSNEFKGLLTLQKSTKKCKIELFGPSYGVSSFAW